MSKSSNDIINDFIRNNSHLKENANPVTQESLKSSVRNINRAEVTAKLRSMGLASVADRLGRVSDDELIRIISQNPGLINKINSFLK